jgi:hypothetical protein
MILFVGTSMANVKDGVWQVHKAAAPPVIDGEMDVIYYAASTERVVIEDVSDATPVESYLDLFASARLLWDANNIYIFVKVVDDEISSTSANSWENDSVEYFFDGDNSKTFESMDGVDDIQLRIEYQDQDDETRYDSFPVGSEGAVADWENLSGDAFGYAVECAIPLEGLSIAAEEGTVIGFELQINDRDNEMREHMFRWWGNSNDAWHWCHLWGEAELIGYTAGDVMVIPMASAAPVVDGVLDDLWVNESVSIESGTYVFQNADVVDASYTEIEEWQDAQMEFRLMWNAAGFYMWVEVIDDEISISSPNAWENDSIEMYWDGDNSKADMFDGVDDFQWRWVWSSLTSGIATDQVAWGELAELDGYTFELAIPQADLVTTLEKDLEIGWDIQVNERDNEVRENMIRWWGNDNMSWQNPYRFGTAVLGDPLAVAVKDRNVAENFALSQNYPNPFNPSTMIQFNLAQRSAVKLNVFDVLGNKVATLVNDVRQAGPNTVAFDGSNLSSGVYFYTLETATEVITKKMMLMK